MSIIRILELRIQNRATETRASRLRAVKLDCGFRADIVVDQRVAVELKCKDVLHPVDEAQLLSHLRLLNLPIGILINFHVVLLKDGIKRLVNNYTEPVSEHVKSA